MIFVQLYELTGIYEKFALHSCITIVDLVRDYMMPQHLILCYQSTVIRFYVLTGLLMLTPQNIF